MQVKGPNSQPHARWWAMLCNPEVITKALHLLGIFVFFSSEPLTSVVPLANKIESTVLLMFMRRKLCLAAVSQLGTPDGTLPDSFGFT